MSQWYAKTSGQVLNELNTSRTSGLSTKQAEERLEQYGPNKLEGAKKQSLAARFLAQMRDPMIIVLLAAAVLSLLSSGGEDWIEALIILVIVVVNACISISQEDSLRPHPGMRQPEGRRIRHDRRVRPREQAGRRGPPR